MGRRTNEQWRRDVYRAPASVLPAAVKILCLYLADHMRQDGRVSVPRDKLAKDLGIHKARVAERITKAIEANYLWRVSAGYPGSVAEYRRFWPDECVQQSGNHSRRMDTAPPDAISTRRAVTIPRAAERENARMETAPLDAIYTADLSVRGADPNVGSDEQAEAHAAPLSACDEHGWTCPEECPDIPPEHRRSA